MLSYIFSIHGVFLSLAGLIFAFFLGALIAYFSNRSLKTLYRIPYFFMFAVSYLVYVLLNYIVNMALLNTNVPLSPTMMAFITSIPAFLFGYIAMYLSVSRARDGFGKKWAAWLLIVPLFNLGLFIVTLDDDPNDNEEPIARNPLSTPPFMNGAGGIIVATIIFALSFVFGMMVLTYPNLGITSTIINYQLQ